MNETVYEYGDDTADGLTHDWPTFIKAMDSGELVEIGPGMFDYFLNVLPPRRMFPGGFTFCEGEDVPTQFWRQHGHIFCQRGAR